MTGRSRYRKGKTGRKARAPQVKGLKSDHAFALLRNLQAHGGGSRRIVA